MEEVLQTSGKKLVEQAEQLHQIGKNDLRIIGDEVFSDQITIARIAYFLAFSQKLIEKFPRKKTLDI